MKNANENISLMIKDEFQFDIGKNYKNIAQIGRNAFKKRVSILISKDRYWPKINSNMHIREVKLYQELRYFERSYRNWLYIHLGEGYPTFYTILGVSSTVDRDKLQNVYQFKRENSYFNVEIVEEAYRTIKNSKNRSKYNRFLKMFRYYYNMLEEEKRLNLDRKHHEWQLHENKKIILSLILERHKNWGVIYQMGINLFYISKIKANNKMRDIFKLYKNHLMDTSKHGQVLVAVCQLFLNSFVYQEYRTFLSNYASYFLNHNECLVIDKLQRHWKKFQFTINDFYELFLNKDPLTEKIITYQSILSSNNDWLCYLPPHKKTYYQVLGIDNPNLNSENWIELGNTNPQFKEMLFEKYKTAQKTPEVNLAYTVLRNPQIRAKYNWMLKYNLVMMKILFLLEINDLGDKHLAQFFKGKRRIEDIIIDKYPCGN